MQMAEDPLSSQTSIRFSKNRSKIPQQGTSQSPVSGRVGGSRHSPAAFGGTSRLTLTKKRMLSPETMEEFTASKSSSPPVSSLASQPSSVSHLRYPANETRRAVSGAAGCAGAQSRPGCGHTHRSWPPRAAARPQQHPGPCEGLLLCPRLVRAKNYKQSAPAHFRLASGVCPKGHSGAWPGNTTGFTHQPTRQVNGMSCKSKGISLAPLRSKKAG